MKQSRRTAVKYIGKGIAATGLLGMTGGMISCKGDQAGKAITEVATAASKEPFFKISLAQWSLHKSFFGKGIEGGFGKFGELLRTDPGAVIQGELDPMDFPIIAKNNFGIEAIEFVNTFYFAKARDMNFLNDMKSRCNGEGVQPVLIMCDALGDLGDTDQAKRTVAVENHHQWVEAANFLGCHSIRVNAAGTGTAEEVMDAAVQGLGALTEFGAKNNVGIIVENHGGYSSDGQWLSSVMKQVNHPNCGTLPDFGNFCIERGENYSCLQEYDRYKGTSELMPFAKGVSAKAHDFDADGNESNTDFRKMLRIVKDAGFKGYVGIEYEGRSLSETEGIKATKLLLEQVGRELS